MKYFVHNAGGRAWAFNKSLLEALRTARAVPEQRLDANIEAAECVFIDGVKGEKEANLYVAECNQNHQDYQPPSVTVTVIAVEDDVELLEALRSASFIRHAVGRFKISIEPSGRIHFLKA
jgi:hypothetical protein